MQPAPNSLYTDPQDLLKRFVPVPFSACVSVRSTEVLVRTNDPAILDGLRAFEARSTLPSPRFVWKIIRDAISAPLLEPTAFRHATVTLVSMGPACLIGVDADTCELFAFVGSNLDDTDFSSNILPLLRDLTHAALKNAGETAVPNVQISPLDANYA